MGPLASYAGRGRWSEPGEAIRECRGRSLRRGDGGPAGLARAPGPEGGEANAEPGLADGRGRGGVVRDPDDAPALDVARLRGGEERVDAVAFEVDRGEAAAEGRVALGGVALGAETHGPGLSSCSRWPYQMQMRVEVPTGVVTATLRRLPRCSSSATSSLPVPASPSRRIGLSVAARLVSTG